MAQHTNNPPNLPQAHSVIEKPSSLFAFNELRSCADLNRMVEKGQLIIDPDFQRENVWPNKKKSEFIDSLARGIPIPSLCIILNTASRKRLVLDGLQRISTIHDFFTNSNWRLANDPEISDALRGKKTYDIDKQSFNEINDCIIPVTILRCDLEEPNAYEFLYIIFHRLNSGGVNLTRQEIRNCIFNGSFNTLLKNLAKNENYISIRRSILRRKKNSRFKDEETILRFFAFHHTFEEYNGKLSSFLNNYMNKNKTMKTRDIEKNKKLFGITLDILKDKVIPEGKTQQKNKALLDGLLIGISYNISYLDGITKQQAQAFYQKIQDHSLYSADALKAGVTEKHKTIRRLITSIKIFSGEND